MMRFSFSRTVRKDMKWISFLQRVLPVKTFGGSCTNSMKSMPATLPKETMLLNKRVVPKRQNPFGMPPPEALL